MTDPARAGRLISLDVFRGATVAAMLLVNNPGSWAHVYPPLLHAEWHGWTPTDLIFPFFLFVVGITTHLSLERQRARSSGVAVLRRIVSRGLLIIAFGVLLNWFPFFTWGQIPEVPDPSLTERIIHRWNHLRWSGVLQRIGLVYLITAPLVWRVRSRGLSLMAAGLLIAYAAILLMIPVPGTGATGMAAIAHPEQTIVAWSDRALLTRDHIWRGGDWDPEGPLSTLPAVTTAILGALAGRILTAAGDLRESIRKLAFAGAVGIGAGYLWSFWLPINKNLWTSSYVLFTAGAAAAGLSLVVWLVEIRRIRRGTGFFVTYGLNPLAAFLGSGLMARLTDSLIRFAVNDRKRSLHSIIHDSLFRSWLPERPASLAYAVAFVLLWYLILKVLERRGWVLRV